MAKMHIITHENAKEECGKALQEQRKYLDTQDYKKAEEELHMTIAKIKKYMAGNVTNLSDGIAILTHFRKVLDRRLAKLRNESGKSKTIISMLRNLQN